MLLLLSLSPSWHWLHHLLVHRAGYRPFPLYFSGLCLEESLLLLSRLACHVVIAAMEQSLSLLPTDVNALKRRRGVTRASITRVGTRLRDFEAKRDQPDTPAAAQQLCSKLRAIDAEFKTIHFQIVDLLDKDEDLDREQVIFDEHEDRVSAFSLRIQSLTHSPTPAVGSSEKNLVSKKLRHLEKAVTTAQAGVTRHCTPVAIRVALC